MIRMTSNLQKFHSPPQFSLYNLFSWHETSFGRRNRVSLSQTFPSLSLSSPSSHPANLKGFLLKLRIKVNMQTNSDSSTNVQTNVSSPQTANVSSTGATNVEAIPKLVVDVDAFGSRVGVHADKFATRMGDLVRTYFPVAIQDWRKIPENYIEDVWNALMAQTNGLQAMEGDRALAWMTGQIGKNEKVNPSSHVTYEQVKDAREKRKPLIDLVMVSALDFENDEIVEVFGADKGRVGLLGYPSHVSKKKALHASLATAVMASNTNPTDNAQKNVNMDETQLLKHTQLVTQIVLQFMGYQLQKKTSCQHQSSRRS